jgi:hypothetical protein
MEEIYAMNWIKADQKDRKDLVIAFTMLQQPFKLKIGKIFVINLETFLKMINSSYGLVAALRKFKLK